MYQKLLEDLRAMPGGPEILLNEPMSLHTTFRIGGPCDVMVTPSDAEEAARVIGIVRSSGLPFFILGNGSNLLVGDRGYRGVVIRLYKKMSRIEIRGEEIRAEAGALMTAIASEAKNAGLEGMEFASGIPGTLGGAVVMNAGAYGGEMKDIIKEADCLCPDGSVRTLSASELEFGYRDSVIQHKGYTVLAAVLMLTKGDPEKVREKMQELKSRRLEKQPLEYPSAGSTFKRPKGYFAGKLIDDAGLRGCQIGGARISDKHCGFLINTGNATARDVRDLMEHVADTVEKQFGVRLEPEVRFLGDF